MSKKGGKDKKPDNNTDLQAQVQQQKREILEQTFTIRQLQDRLSRMTQENHEIVTTRDSTQKKYEQKIDNQRIFLENHENTIQRLNKKVTSLEFSKLELQTIVRTQEKQIQILQQTRIRQMDQYKKLVGSEMAILESQLKQYNNYMKERDDLFDQRNKLKNDLQVQKQDTLRELADKERQKVQETDQLKDEMLMKIRDMRTNLLSLKKQQLSTTTRLAVLQNHQLTSELQYQSKQTQKLLFQNENLQKKLANMQKDVEIHKQVQEELAKRSHVSKGIIKKLTTKISELEQQLKKYKEDLDEGQKIGVQNISGQKSASLYNTNTLNQGSSGSKITKKFYEQSQSQLLKQEQLISLLQKTIQEKDKKLLKIQSEIGILETENKLYRQKQKQSEKRSYELSVILLKYYQDILSGNIEVKVNENEKDQFLLDVKGIKKKNVKDWDNQEVKLIVLILLNQLKNNINKYNLGIPAINKSQISLIGEEEINHNQSSVQQSKLLPNIGGVYQHSLLRKDSKKIKQIPTSLAPKLVGSNLRQWGRTVHSNSVSNISKKLNR